MTHQEHLSETRNAEENYLKALQSEDRIWMGTPDEANKIAPNFGFKFTEVEKTKIFDEVKTKYAELCRARDLNKDTYHITTPKTMYSIAILNKCLEQRIFLIKG